MSLTIWLSLALVCLLGAMSPGPSLLMVSKHALAGGRKNGFAAAWAHACGIGIYAFITMVGLAVVLESSPLLFRTITIAGAGYLAWLGLNALRARGGVAARLQAGHQASAWKAAREGFLISLLSPKIALFFIALFSQFVGHETTLTGKLLIVFTPFLIDGLWYTLITLLLSAPKVVEKIRSRAVLIDRISGALLLALAARVVFSL